MRMQRKSPWSLDGVTPLPAAAQHDFPEPDTQIMQMGRNPTRPFAALATGSNITVSAAKFGGKRLYRFVQMGIDQTKTGSTPPSRPDITLRSRVKVQNQGKARPRGLIGAQDGCNMQQKAFHLGNVGSKVCKIEKAAKEVWRRLSHGPTLGGQY
jgi:hypothetical protein